MRIVMCAPVFYGVYYEINPWMRVVNQPDIPLATKQWEDLYETFRKLGVDVELIQPQKGLPDMVFTANAGFVLRRSLVRSASIGQSALGGPTWP